VAGSTLLIVGVVVLLFLVVFPWAEPRLPFNHVTVDTPPPASQSGHTSPTPPPPLP